MGRQIQNPKALCPCFSGKDYDICCRPFHLGAKPENALLLMRSRYSAFALNIPDYIIATTHPDNLQYSANKLSWKRSISDFATHSSFNDLIILDFEEKDNTATVTFTAFISHEGRDATFTEKSSFKKENDQWLYWGGQLNRGNVPP